MTATPQTMQLINCLSNSEDENYVGNLALFSMKLVPSGKPDFAIIRTLPAISQLHDAMGAKDLLKILQNLINNFCDSLNVVRNMNKAQVMDCAVYLLSECGTYRLEDYVMMFTMAKRGHLGKIYDRVDIEFIGNIRAEYDKLRHAYGEAQQMEIDRLAVKERNLIPEKDEPEEVKVQRFKDASKMFKEMVAAHEKERQEKPLKEMQSERRKRYELYQNIKDKLGVDLSDLEPPKE